MPFSTRGAILNCVPSRLAAPFTRSLLHSLISFALSLRCFAPLFSLHFSTSCSRSPANSSHLSFHKLQLNVTHGAWAVLYVCARRARDEKLRAQCAFACHSSALVSSPLSVCNKLIFQLQAQTHTHTTHTLIHSYTHIATNTTRLTFRKLGPRAYAQRASGSKSLTTSASSSVSACNRIEWNGVHCSLLTCTHTYKLINFFLKLQLSRDYIAKQALSAVIKSRQSEAKAVCLCRASLEFSAASSPYRRECKAIVECINVFFASVIAA